LPALLLSTGVPALGEESKPMKTNSLDESKDQKAAELVVRKYMEFLHLADTESIMKLYDEDAVFLPADAPTVVGKAKIRESYIENFKIMNIPEGESTLEEATIHGDLAIVRLATKSTVVILANKEKILTNARELFVLNKVGDSYKISRYMFNKL
jgi:ketosteroid isomerase-like protein